MLNGIPILAWDQRKDNLGEFAKRLHSYLQNYDIIRISDHGMDFEFADNGHLPEVFKETSSLSVEILKTIGQGLNDEDFLRNLGKLKGYGRNPSQCYSGQVFPELHSCSFCENSQENLSTHNLLSMFLASEGDLFIRPGTLLAYRVNHIYQVSRKPITKILSLPNGLKFFFEIFPNTHV